MPDSRKKVRQIIGITAGIWSISLLALLLYVKIKGTVSIWALAGYGVWNIMLFLVSYFRICTEVNKVMEKMNDSIKSLIGGHPRQNFSMEEESLQGKFQMQLLKLYHMMDGAREAEEHMRKEMGGIVADLVHQINTPVTNIQMYSQFLAQDELSPEEREEMCQVIQSQVEKLGWFAEGFGKTARLEGDIMKIQPTPQPILHMILGAIDQIALKAQKHGNEILLNGDQEIKAVYDRRWTEEAVFNVLDNAVKYSRESTPIIVEMTAYQLFVKIDIKNYGEPIRKEDYNQIFKRFYRGSNAALVKEGVGLGLYLTRKILTEQGGYIKAGADGSAGNVFSIFLRSA